MQKLFIDQELIKITHDAEKREVASAYGDLTVPLDGVLIHGLFVDAGLFDNLSMTLVDPNPGICMLRERGYAISHVKMCKCKKFKFSISSISVHLDVGILGKARTEVITT
uniref:Uncharacterized protein n=6 Tax=Photinus pyralis TaxID=7054 RepID=A0A1Y1M8U6_PHOPY